MTTIAVALGADLHAAQTCAHTPPCPLSDASDHDAAVVIAAFPEQGWSLLCNGIVRFDDTGELLPDRHAVPPHRAAALHAQTGAGR